MTPNSDDYTQYGLVIVNFGRTTRVRDAAGQERDCTMRRGVPTLVSGDRVRWRASEPDAGVVVELLPRTTLLSRADPAGESKSVAANVDQLLVVVACRPPMEETLINRYLVAAEHLGVTPLLLVNKLDLFNDDDRAQLANWLGPWKDIGYRLLFCSSKSGVGLDTVRSALNDKTSIFVGQSGVGKSSLAKRFLPNTEIATGALARSGHLGRHTTSATTLYELPGGGHVIDSPGVRDFGLSHIPSEDLAPGFIEFRPYLGQCKFRDCAHRTEPGCAVLAAAEQGRISPRRLASYHTLFEASAAKELKTPL